MRVYRRERQSRSVCVFDEEEIQSKREHTFGVIISSVFVLD